jgi:hypothetical protein
MWLIEGIFVGSLGSVHSNEDGGCVENSVLNCGRERGGWRSTAAFTIGSQDKKGARAPLLSDPVIISCSHTLSKLAHIELSIYIYEGRSFHVRVLTLQLFQV